MTLKTTNDKLDLIMEMLLAVRTHLEDATEALKESFE